VTSAATGQDLLRRARAGHVPSTSQLITALEARTPLGAAILAEVFAAGGNAHVVGVTGAPGSGKSTLVSAFAHELRSRGARVGIVAVDPSSTLSGGSILGDRIRMQRHVLDEGVFVRSMSSRGRLGGLSRATVDAVAVLDAAGWDVVVVETVGVGQADVEIVQIAHTTLVVSVPGLGDDIQAIKAGLLEMADLHVVNKVDRPDANKTMAELLTMLHLGPQPAPGAWAVPVLGTVGLDGTGVADLVDGVERHLEWLRTSGELERRQRANAAARIRAVTRDLLLEEMDAQAGDEFEELIEAVASRRQDPHSASRQLIRSVAARQRDLERTA
jgi:LAO/AO transport system kinase